MILPCVYQSYWILLSAIVKTLVCFAYLASWKQSHFNKFYSINIYDKRNDCIFIEPHTSLTPLPEAIGLYVIFDRLFMQLDTLSFHYITDNSKLFTCSPSHLFF